MHDITTRPATPDDTTFLWHMLTLAASMGGTDEDIARAKVDPALTGYVDGFGGDGDLGIIALHGGSAVGAAWLRLLRGAPHPAKVWTPETPELAIATLPAARGFGVGTVLLRAVIDAARGRYPAIALSVRAASPAVRLYERFGFAEERRIVNRVGGVSLVMRRPLP
jgi:GNAT superfamily N-acetyltransferase